MWLVCGTMSWYNSALGSRLYYAQHFLQLLGPKIYILTTVDSKCYLTPCSMQLLHVTGFKWPDLCDRLPAVEETILKRKKRIDAAQARQARANLRAKKVFFLKIVRAGNFGD